MKTQEVINQLQKLVEKYGDCLFRVYDSSTGKNLDTLDGDIAYDDTMKDIFIFLR